EARVDASAREPSRSRLVTQTGESTVWLYASRLFFELGEGIVAEAVATRLRLRTTATATTAAAATLVTVSAASSTRRRAAGTATARRRRVAARRQRNAAPHEVDLEDSHLE